MGDWTDGYVSDIEYSAGFYAEQMPAHLDAACLVRGVEPPVAPGEAFRYCELGCGVGKSTATVAAVSPQAKVWGFDFNPAHIARGRRLARDAGLDNLILEDTSFEDLAGERGRTLPRFHYIALHGVWAWVSPANRRHIVDFIADHLEPGGLVYITYNALPGWNAAAPLQRALWKMADFDNDRSDHRVVRAIDFARKLADAGAPAIPREYLDRLNSERDNGNVAYLAHEYLNAYWAPCYQMDVAEALSPTKATFAASANILDNYPDICLTTQQRELVESSPHGFRETLKDYFMARSFRRDVYICGSRPIPPRRLDDRLRALRLTAIVPEAALTRDIRVPIGEATLNEAFYGPALRRIADSTPTIGELLDDPAVREAKATPREALGMLIGSRQAMSVNPVEQAGAIDRVRRYNVAQMRVCAESGQPTTALAGTAIGSAVTVRVFEMLTYEALVEGVPPELDLVVDDCWERLSRRGDRLTEKGAPIEGEAANRALLKSNIPEVLAVALPMWRRIGAI